MEKYNAKIRDSKKVELIYYNLDDSAREMEAFMRRFQMPWPAIAYGKRASWGLGAALVEAAGSEVPGYVLLDVQGKVRATGRDEVFAAVEKVVGGEPVGDSETGGGTD